MQISWSVLNVLAIFKNHREKNMQGKMKLYCKRNECKKWHFSEET